MAEGVNLKWPKGTVYAGEKGSIFVVFPVNTEELISTLKNAVKCYNQIPNAQLYGFTPNEVLTGVKPDKYHFKNQIAVGKKKRLTENQNFPCAMVCQV